MGTYHSWSAKHLDLCVAEFTGRHNIRPLDTLEQMEETARGMFGKRLRYADLVKRRLCVYSGATMADQDQSPGARGQTPSGSPIEILSSRRRGLTILRVDTGYLGQVEMGLTQVRARDLSESLQEALKAMNRGIGMWRWWRSAGPFLGWVMWVRWKRH